MRAQGGRGSTVAQTRVLSGSAASRAGQGKVFSANSPHAATSTAADRQKRRSALQSLANGLLLALMVSGLTLGLNQPVTLSVDAYPGKTFSGVISRISPSLDEKARTLTLEATVPTSLFKSTWCWVASSLRWLSCSSSATGAQHSSRPLPFPRRSFPPTRSCGCRSWT